MARKIIRPRCDDEAEEWEAPRAMPSVREWIVRPRRVVRDLECGEEVGEGEALPTPEERSERE